MAPKGKGKGKKKGKSSSAADDGSSDKMSKEQMWEYAVRLQEEVDRVREEKRYFQLERDKAQARLEISKKNVEEAEDYQRNQRRQREEARERHLAEIAIYKKKIKHILCEQNSMISELKMDSALSSSLVQDQHTGEELVLIRDIQALQADLNERKLRKDNLTQKLKLKHQTELMEMYRCYECKLLDIQDKYDMMTSTMVMEEEKTMLENMCTVDCEINSYVSVLTEEHCQELSLLEANPKKDAPNPRQLIEEMNLKRQKKAMKFNRDAKHRSQGGMKDADRWHKDLQKGLKDGEGLTSDGFPDEQQQYRCSRQVPKHLREPRQNCKDMLLKRRADLKTLDKEIREMTVENELLMQACEKMEQERDDLLKRRTEGILDVQQKSEMHKLLLQKKLAAVEEDLEKAEAQLWGVLAVSSLDPKERRNAAKRLEEIMSHKQSVINKHQEDLDQECNEYDDRVKIYKMKLQASGSPLHDFCRKSSKELLKAAPFKP